MAISLTQLPAVNSRESKKIIVTFSATPTTPTWTLQRPDGTVINSREDVAFSLTDNAETLHLYGDDTEISSNAGESEDRQLIVTATVGTERLVEGCVFAINRVPGA